MSTKKSFTVFVSFIIAGCLLICAFVWFFDPFYQYHEPFGGRQAVLNDRDNQVPGTIRSFSYENVLVGSSVAENFNSEFIKEAYGGETLKIIRASGSLVDLLYYLKQAHARQDLKKIYWCMDLFAINNTTECSLYGANIPRYLHTATVLDDIPYVFNKEIIFEKIPFMLASEKVGKNVGGDAYNWADGKNFGPAQAMRAYDRPKETLPPGDDSKQRANVSENLKMLSEYLEAHQDIEYCVIFPPYSLIWWDCIYKNGELQLWLDTQEQLLRLLVTFDNVDVHFFQAETDIVCNLDYYMDLIHYSPDINQYMLEALSGDEYLVTKDNADAVITNMKSVVDFIINEKIYDYYE